MDTQGPKIQESEGVRRSALVGPPSPHAAGSLGTCLRCRAFFVASHGWMGMCRDTLLGLVHHPPTLGDVGLSKAPSDSMVSVLRRRRNHPHGATANLPGALGLSGPRDVWVSPLCVGYRTHSCFGLPRCLPHQRHTCSARSSFSLRTQRKESKGSCRERHDKAKAFAEKGMTKQRLLQRKA